MRNNGNCVIFSGQTGIRMGAALDKLAALCRDRGVNVRWNEREQTVEERLKEEFSQQYHDDASVELIRSDEGLQFLLFKPKTLLYRLWQSAFRKTIEAPPEGHKQTMFVSMHPVLYHSENREFFSPIDVDKLRELLKRSALKVSLVISLIDDVYDVFRRLRGAGELFSPTLPIDGTPGARMEAAIQSALELMLLLEWRAKEVMVAEQIAKSLDAEHYVLATKHPTTVAFDLLFTSKIPVYVSHPITGPRTLELNDRREEAQQIMANVNSLVRLLAESRQLIPFFPTTIDEFVIERRGVEFLPKLRTSRVLKK